ncbi:MAG TPA: NUDIX hydrolase [Aestuariivirgaceae bacterium]|jgi:8-oxo-dGTP pyrophosphatase MutT (NUDIX family)
MTEVKHIHDVSLSVDPRPWPYETENLAKVNRHWTKAQAENPALHNGQVFMLTNWSFAQYKLDGVVQPANYATFLYWRDQGYPETGARNCFGSSVLQSREGHILFGRSAAHTATSGQVYPVGGSLSGEDVEDGMLRIEANILRELYEETGLKLEDANREAGYICVEVGPWISLAARFMFECDSVELRRRIQTYLDTSEEPELDGVIIFRRKSFARHHRMPGYARVLIEHLLT